MSFSTGQLKWIEKMILSREINKDALDKLLYLASSEDIKIFSLEDIRSLEQFLDLLLEDVPKDQYTNIFLYRQFLNISRKLEGKAPLKIVPSFLVLQTMEKDNLTLNQALIKLDKEVTLQALIDLNQEDSSYSKAFFDKNNCIKNVEPELIEMYNVTASQKNLLFFKMSIWLIKKKNIFTQIRLS